MRNKKEKHFLYPSLPQSAIAQRLLYKLIPASIPSGGPRGQEGEGNQTELLIPSDVWVIFGVSGLLSLSQLAGTGLYSGAT